MSTPAHSHVVFAGAGRGHSRGATLFDEPVFVSCANRLADRASDTLHRQIQFASIPAPTGEEHERANAFHSRLSMAGIDAIRRDAVGNVIARLDGAPDTHAARRERGPVVVMAHLDTVGERGPLPEARYEGTRVLLPGIGDNARGLAALVSIAEVLHARPDALGADRTVELVATVGEEGVGNLRGAREYLDDRARRGAPSPSAVIALDGPGDTLVVHHGIASQRLRFSYDAPGGHPWADVGRANAVHAAALAMGAIARLASAEPHGTRITITRMAGGESLTAIPMHAWFDVDLRALNPAEMQRVARAVRQTAEGASHPVRPRVQLLGERPGGALDHTHPLVALANAATMWQGCEPQSASASSDANVALSRGIPAIAIGAGGRGGDAHSVHEWYDDTHSARGLVRALSIIVGATRLPLSRLP